MTLKEETRQKHVGRRGEEKEGEGSGGRPVGRPVENGGSGTKCSRGSDRC